MTPEIDDILHKRFESFIQVIHGLLNDFTEKHVKAVDSQIRVTVNGKIDAIKIQLDKQDKVLERLDADTSPIIKTKVGLEYFFKALLWSCGTVAAVGGAYLVLVNIF